MSQTIYKISKQLQDAYGYFPYTHVRMADGSIREISSLTEDEFKLNLIYAIVKAATRDVEQFLTGYTNQDFGDEYIQSLYLELIRRYKGFVSEGTLYFGNGSSISFDEPEELLEIVDGFQTAYPWITEYVGYKYRENRYLNDMSDQHILGALFVRLQDVLRRLDDGELISEAFDIQTLREIDPVVDGLLISLT